MFDPYHKWLAIPKDQRPPNHYQLLGLAAGESDPEVIDEAALRQTAHVRTYQLGQHGADCTRILNEIALARTTLLNPAKKKDYDAQLAKKVERAPARSDQIAAKPAAQAIAKDFAFEEPDDPIVNAGLESRTGKKPARSTKTGKLEPKLHKDGVFLTKGMLIGIVGGAAAFLVVVVVILVGFAGKGDGRKPDKGGVAQLKKDKDKKKGDELPPVDPEDKKLLDVKPPKQDPPKKQDPPIAIADPPEFPKDANGLFIQGEIDCGKESLRRDIGKDFDITKSWVLSCDFWLPDLLEDEPRQFLIWSDERGGYDPIHLSQIGDRIYTRITDCRTDAQHAIEVPFGVAAQEWHKATVRYLADARTLDSFILVAHIPQPELHILLRHRVLAFEDGAGGGAVADDLASYL